MSLAEQLVSGEDKFAAPFSANEIVESTNPLEVTGSLPAENRSISTDTRTLLPGEWFIALPGDRRDGHSFVQSAISRGAAGCIVSKAIGSIDLPPDTAIVRVFDTAQAYRTLAALWRTKVHPKVISICGGEKRRRIREMCSFALSNKSCHRANEILTLPQTLLSMPPATEILIVDGVDADSALAKLLLADLVIIGAVDFTENGLRTVDELIGSCSNIIDAAAPYAIAIIGEPVEPLANYVRKKLSSGKVHLYAPNTMSETTVPGDCCRLRIKEFNVDIVISVMERGDAQAAWCAAIAAREIGLGDQEIASGLAKSIPPHLMRVALQP